MDLARAATSSMKTLAGIERSPLRHYGLTLESIKRAMGAGIGAACSDEGIVEIRAANYGGTLGPIKLYIRKPSAEMKNRFRSY